MYQAELIFKDEILPKKGVKIPFGIHTKVSVTSVERGKTEKDKSYFDVNFELDGRFHNIRLWDPSGAYPKQGESTQDAIEREARTNLAHLVRLMHIFLGEDAMLKFSAKTYEDFITKAIALLTPKLKNKFVNLKVTYDKDGVYPEVAKYDYLEEYNEGVEPTIAFSKWEKENRCTYKGETAVSATSQKEVDNELLALLGGTQ